MLKSLETLDDGPTKAVESEQSKSKKKDRPVLAALLKGGEWLVLLLLGYAIAVGLDLVSPDWVYRARLQVERAGFSEAYSTFVEGRAEYYAAWDSNEREQTSLVSARFDAALEKLRSAADEGLTEAKFLVGLFLCTGREHGHARNVPDGVQYLSDAYQAGNDLALAIMVSRCESVASLYKP